MEAEMARERRERERALAEELKSSDTPHEPAVIEAYLKFLDRPDAEDTVTDGVEDADAGLPDKWLAEIVPYLGPVGETSVNENAFSAKFGSASRAGTSVEIFLQFDSLPSGLVALAEWLDAQGCREMRYRISNSAALAD